MNFQNLTNRLSKEDYVKQSWDKGYQYLEDISSGKIVSNQWIKLAVKRFQNDLDRNDLEYRSEEIYKVFRFFSVLNVDNQKTQFSLMPFQAFALMNLFGFYYKRTNRRKYNYAFLFMARKNGKTGFIAALNLYFLVASGISNPLCLSIGSSPDARSHSAREASNFVYNTHALDSRLTPQGPKVSKNTIVFTDKKKSGSLKSVVSLSDRLDGYSTSSAILDECHTYKDDSLFNVIKSSIGRRYSAGENPLITLISTAGFLPTGFCANMIDIGKKVLEGKMKDDNFFYLIYTLDEEDGGDWRDKDSTGNYEDQNIWIKSNPALGELLDIEYLRGEYAQAKNLPSQMGNFKTKHLNIFVNQTSEWIKPEDYLPVCYNSPEEDYKDLTGFIGLDLSATRDLTALSLVFYDKDKDFYHVIHHFFRANNPDKRFRAGGQDLQEWIDAGYIQECSKPTIDYDLIWQKIKEWIEKYYIGSIVFDRFLAQLVIPNVESLYRPQDGGKIKITPFSQTSYKFGFPMTMFHKSIFDRNIALSDNPCLQWMIDNVVLYYDTNGNMKPMKNKGKDAIDGVMSTTMGFAGALDWYNVVNNTNQ